MTLLRADLDNTTSLYYVQSSATDRPPSRVLTPGLFAIKRYPMLKIPTRHVCLSSLCKRLSRSCSFEVIWPALLLWPKLRVVRLGVDLQLLQVRVNNLLAAVGALVIAVRDSLKSVIYMGSHTMLVGFGALTGRPLALTGALVPALSAARCSR